MNNASIMVSRCGLNAIIQNLRFWEKSKYVVIFSTVTVRDVLGAWTPADIIKSVDRGGVVTLVNDKEKRKIVVSRSDRTQEGAKDLPYSYAYRSMAVCKERSPAAAGSSGKYLSS